MMFALGVIVGVAITIVCICARIVYNIDKQVMVPFREGARD